MRSFAETLLGHEAARLLGIVAGDMPEPEEWEDGDLAARTRQAGQWCATTPPRAPVPPSPAVRMPGATWRSHRPFGI